MRYLQIISMCVCCVARAYIVLKLLAFLLLFLGFGLIELRVVEMYR